MSNVDEALSKSRKSFQSPSSAGIDDVDFVTCGSCQKEFLLSDIVLFMRHKKHDCDETFSTGTSVSLHQQLMCQIKDCQRKFSTAWALLQHVQNRHIPNIYSAMKVYDPGIELLQVQANSRDAFDLNTKTTGRMDQEVAMVTQENGVDVDSLCVLSLGDTFDDIQRFENHQPPGKRPAHHKQTLLGQKKSVPTVSCRSVEVQTEQFNICLDGNCAEQSCEKKCCDNQNCCITIMPGTHEKPRRCCSAIVPKKRKQHMEMKHMPNGRSGVSTRSQRRRSGDRSYSFSRQNDTIYIDFTPSNMEFSADDYSYKVNPAPSMERDQQSGMTFKNDPVIASTCTSNSTSRQHPESVISSQHSVIIQPGTFVTIPSSRSQPVFSTHIPAQTQEKMAVGGIGSKENEVTIKSSAPASLPFGYIPEVSNQNLPMTTETPPLQFNGKLSTVPALSGLATLNVPVHNLGKAFDPSDVNITDFPGMSTKISPPFETGSTSMQPSFTSKMTKDDETVDTHAGGKRRRYPTSRPFKCEQCGHSFNQRIHLKKHLSKHTGIKPYKCQQCDYSTVERSHLKVHIRIHTGEKPFKCTFCEYATAQNSTLKIHLKRHHSSTVLNSTVCGKEFGQPIQLNNHRKEHGVIMEDDGGSRSPAEDNLEMPGDVDINAVEEANSTR